MKPFVGIVASFASTLCLATSVQAQYSPGWTIRGSGSSVSSYATFGRSFAMRTNSYEYEKTVRPGGSRSLVPRQTAELPPNECGPRAFQVVNAGHAEPNCVGTPLRR